MLYNDKDVLLMETLYQILWHNIGARIIVNMSQKTLTTLDLIMHGNVICKNSS